MLGNRSKSAIKTAVYKATDHKAYPSKEKHVRAIILRTFSKERDNSVEQIIRYLTLRLDKTNWAVVLKCLMIFHRCFRDGDASFIESMKPRSHHTFSLQKFNATAPATHLYTVFVKKYAKYLEEKVSVLRLLGYQFEKNKESVKNLKPPKCFKIVPKLQSQLNALLNCKMRTQHVGQNPLIHRTYILIMKDSLVLYTMLNDAILQLLDLFWKMKKKNAAKVVSIYKLFVKETDALIGLYEIGKRFVRQLPEIKKAETSIIDSMEKHVEDLPDDESSEEASGGSGEKTGKKHKTKKTPSKKRHSEDESSNGAQLKEGEEDEYDDYEEKDRKYDDDSDEARDDESSSGEDEEPEDLLKDFFNAPAFPAVHVAPFAPTTFGPTAFQPEPSYQEKANFIKQIAAVSDPYTPNPFAPAPTTTGVNLFQQGGIISNPFQVGAQTPNPWIGGSSNPFTVGNSPPSSSIGSGFTSNTNFPVGSPSGFNGGTVLGNNIFGPSHVSGGFGINANVGVGGTFNTGVGNQSLNPFTQNTPASTNNPFL